MPTRQAHVARCVLAPIDPVTLSLFRVAFGGLLCIDAARCWLDAERRFPAWEFRPPPLPFAWLEGLPAVPAAPCLVVAAVSAALIAVGAFTRLAATVFAFAYAALYLWDPTQFNNHHYLIVLLAGWMAVLGLNREFAVDAWRSPAIRLQPTLWWHLGIFLFHIALVYAFGAINKFNADWLRGEPLSIWLGVEQHRPLIGSWLAHPAAKYVFAYGGLLFDAAIVPLLCWRRSRAVALVLTVAFHLANSVLFQIGPFPWLMLAANVLFLDRAATRRAVEWCRGRISRFSFLVPSPPSAGERVRVRGRVEALVSETQHRTWVLGALAAYMLLHVLIPFRAFLLSDNPEWTEDGKNYSWRMMLSHKDTFVGILVVDLADGRVWEVDPREYLSHRQLRGKGVWGHPRHLAAFARMLRREAVARGFRDPFVKVDAVASLNGRPHQYLVDPDIDLSLAEQSFWSLPAWVVPLQHNQPIGDYSFLDPQIKQDRVMSVIQRHRSMIGAEARRATAGRAAPSAHVARVDQE